MFLPTGEVVVINVNGIEDIVAITDLSCEEDFEEVLHYFENSFEEDHIIRVEYRSNNTVIYSKDLKQ